MTSHGNSQQSILRPKGPQEVVHLRRVNEAELDPIVGGNMTGLGVGFPGGPGLGRGAPRSFGGMSRRTTFDTGLRIDQDKPLVHLGQKDRLPVHHVHSETDKKRLRTINAKYNRNLEKLAKAKGNPYAAWTINPYKCLRRCACAKEFTTRGWCQGSGIFQMVLGATGGVSTLVIRFGANVPTATRYQHATDATGLFIFLLMFLSGVLLVTASTHTPFYEAGYFALGSLVIMVGVGGMSGTVAGLLGAFPYSDRVYGLVSYLVFQALLCWYWAICALALYLDFRAGAYLDYGGYYEEGEDGMTSIMRGRTASRKPLKPMPPGSHVKFPVPTPTP